MEYKKTKEERIIKEIIDSCNGIIDQLLLGATPNDADYNSLGYIHGSISAIQKRIANDLDNQITQDVQKARQT
jgi:hypothetical protein